MTGFGAYDYTQQSDTLAAAVEVNATVTDTHIEQSSSGRSGIDYIPVVSFQYTFEDETYNSSEMYASMSSRDYDSTAAAQDVLDDYTVGETVTAYVDPATPGEAFLKHERSQEPLTFLGLGG